MTLFMLDTNTVSDLIRGQAAVAKRLRATAPTDVCISAITAGELYFGLARRPEASRLRRVVEELLARVEIIPWTDDVARTYGRARAALSGKGTPMSDLDMLIAAHALDAGATLVTRDRSFAGKLAGLRVANWALA